VLPGIDGGEARSQDKSIFVRHSRDKAASNTLMLEKK
jgi:hypothetical protein